MKNHYVYMHIFPNNKVYIGITSKKPEYRWNNGNGYNSQNMMRRAINKYGWKNITHLILFDNLTKEQAEDKEIELIAYYKSNDINFGYNLSIGGEKSSKGVKRTEDFKNNIKDKITGIKRSEETKQKLSLSKLGKPSWNKGKRGSSKSFKINQYDLNNNFIRTFNSAREAGDFIGKDHKAIINHCKNNKPLNNYYWKLLTQ